jgi:hypothetical protein
MSGTTADQALFIRAPWRTREYFPKNARESPAPRLTRSIEVGVTWLSLLCLRRLERPSRYEGMEQQAMTQSWDSPEAITSRRSTGRARESPYFPGCPPPQLLRVIDRSGEQTVVLA